MLLIKVDLAILSMGFEKLIVKLNTISTRSDPYTSTWWGLNKIIGLWFRIA